MPWFPNSVTAMARTRWFGLVLACLVGQAGTVAAYAPPAPHPPARTQAVRLYHDATPGELSLTVEARSSDRDEGNFIAVFTIWRIAGKPPRLIDADVMDVGPDNERRCIDPECDLEVHDGRFRYRLTAQTVAAQDLFVVVRGIDPRITVSGKGWHQRADLAVYQYGSTSGGGTRTYAAFGRAYERFAGIPVSRPLRESIAYAAVPCDEFGQGTAALRGSGKALDALACDGRTSTVRYAPTSTRWELTGSVEGLTTTYTRLLVVGRA